VGGKSPRRLGDVRVLDRVQVFFSRHRDGRARVVSRPGVGFFTIAVQTSISLLILRDPPKSLARRLVALRGAIVLASLTLVIWVMMADWLEARS
jgi:hypothetical protein